MNREHEIADFLQSTKWAQAKRTHVAGDASNRRYFRLHGTDGETVILMDAPPSSGEDIRPFVKIAQYLQNVGLSAPTVQSKDDDAGLILMEDFGDDQFYDIVEAEPDLEVPLYRLATDVLIELHSHTPPGLTVCDQYWLIDAIAPVFEWYAPTSESSDIRELTQLLTPHAKRVAEAGTVMILRDFHAQNLMRLKDRPGLRSVGLLDFQDAMLGHPAYDLVSILQDARRDLSEDTESRIKGYFCDKTGCAYQKFEHDYAFLGLQRNLRILGIFARLSRRDGKPQYIDFVPRVWRYIERNLRHPEFDEIDRYLRSVLPLPTQDFLTKLRTP